jgi:predicted PurR-regulated permease PerM
VLKIIIYFCFALLMFGSTVNEIKLQSKNLTTIKDEFNNSLQLLKKQKEELDTLQEQYNLLEDIKEKNSLALTINKTQKLLNSTYNKN